MSCKYCDYHKKQSDFDGETYLEIRIGTTCGYPAIVSTYKNAWCIASYGINFCPWCGADLRKEREEPVDYLCDMCAHDCDERRVIKVGQSAYDVCERWKEGGDGLVAS